MKNTKTDVAKKQLFLVLSATRRKGLILTDEKRRDLLKLNEKIFKKDGSFKTFKEQLLEYKTGIFPKRAPLIILPSTDVLHIQGLRSAPLVISQEIFEHIERGHDILVMDLFDLRENIENYVLAMDSKTQTGSIVIILNVTNKENEFIVVPVHLSKKLWAVEIHSVRSTYGKENIEKWILSTYNAGLGLYANEKTERWLQSLGVQFPQSLVNSLSLNKYTENAD